MIYIILILGSNKIFLLSNVVNALNNKTIFMILLSIEIKNTFITFPQTIKELHKWIQSDNGLQVSVKEDIR